MDFPEKTDILLINPPSGLFYGLGPNFAPIGLFSLAAYLGSKGFSVSVLNANYFPDYEKAGPLGGSGAERPDQYYYADDHHNPVWRQVLDFVGLVEPRLLGFSCHDLAVGGVKFLAEEIKRRWPGMITAAGGPTPTGAPEIFSDCRALDFILPGEGEKNVLDLAETLRSKDWLTPMADRPVPFPFGGAAAEPIKDLDSLPDPQRDYYWLDYSRRTIIRDVQLNGVATSRGCLKACRFCGARTLWPGPVRYRSISRVVEEIIELRSRYGFDFQHFSIFDDDFLARPDRVMEFCRLLNETGDDYRFRCYGRVSNLQNEEVIETVLKAGCQEIWVGVESGSQKVLKDLGKGITVEQIKRLDRLFANYDFPWLAFIILGTPSEDEADLAATLDMLRRGVFPSIQPFTFHPYTGTDLFRELQSSGRLDYDDIIRGHQNLPLCFSQKLSPEIFFAALDAIKKLARQRHNGWSRNFNLTDSQEQKALAWESACADWLRSARKPWLVMGPERQLRWLAALNHYQELGADLTLVDLTAPEDNPTRFGKINGNTALDNFGDRNILLVAPAVDIDDWRTKINSHFPSRPVSIVGAAEPFAGPDEAFWRPVYRMLRPGL